MDSDKEGDYEYRDMVDQLNEVIQKYEETYDILLCGDMKKRQTTIYTIVIIYFFNIGIMLNIKT
jgi:predicted RNase H-related nuclease YkuK (DUF458 family)